MLYAGSLCCLVMRVNGIAFCLAPPARDDIQFLELLPSRTPVCHGETALDRVQKSNPHYHVWPILHRLVGERTVINSY